MAIGWAVARAVGQALLGMAATLLTGSAFRKLVVWPFEWLAARTRNKRDDELVRDAKNDLGIDQTEGGK